MTRSDLIDESSAAEPSLSKPRVRAVHDGVFATIREAAIKSDDAAVPGFGKFKVQDKPARTARNPRNGESIAVAATRNLRFQPAKALKDALIG